MYDHIKDYNDPYWIWMIEIRRFLRYILMTEISDKQVIWKTYTVLYFLKSFLTGEFQMFKGMSIIDIQF